MSKDELKKLINEAKKEYERRMPYNYIRLGQTWSHGEIITMKKQRC